PPRGGEVAGRRLPAREVLRRDLAPDPALVRGPPRRPLAFGRRAGPGLGPGAGRCAGDGRASGGGGDRRPVDPRPDRGGLEPPDRRPGQCADPAALRPGPVRRPGAGGPGRRLSRAGSATFPRLAPAGGEPLEYRAQSATAYGAPP